MKILFSQLPQSPWWGKGTPVYKDNWAMHEGVVPNQKIVEKEHRNCIKTIRKHTKLETVVFPDELDTHNLYKHDGVFVRDAFISNQKGDFVISNFSERRRQPEVAHVAQFLKGKGHKLHYLPSSAFAEGGEFYFIPKNNLIFAGICRNNKKGVEETARLLAIEKVFIIEVGVMHLDAAFSPIMDKKGYLCGAIACLKLIKNKIALKKYFEKLHLPLIQIEIGDAVSPKGEGSMAINCLPLPGKLFGGGIFETPGVEENLKNLGVQHIISPVTQFKFSGGGIHCLTNELLS